MTARDEEETCMARKRSAREDADTSKPRQLRKRLRKAEDQLADAVQKRDRAQARVEALGIIADEIRAQLAETEQAADAEQGATSGAEPGAPARREPAKPTRPARKATGRARVSSGTPPPAEAPAADGRDGTAASNASTPAADGRDGTAASNASTPAVRPARKAAASARKRVTPASGPSPS
jgi:hypothetical protein